MFDALGFGQIPVFGAATTESGTTATDWVQPGRLQTIADELAARPEVGIVMNQFDGYFETRFDVIFRTSFR